MLDSIFEVVWIIGFIAGSIIRGVGVHRSQYKRDKESRFTGLERLLLLLTSLGMFFIPLLYLLTPWLDFADYHLPPWAGWAGAVVFALGLWLLWRSHADLGRNFSPMLEIMDGHSLVTQGVFRYIRHPMYAAHGLWAIAQALLLQNGIAGLAMLATFMPLYIQRVPREEQMMLEHFGEEYRLYMNRTGRVIPRIWR